MLFYKICNVKVLDVEDEFAVFKAQQLFFTVDLKHNLIYIKTNFNTITTYITHIKTFRISLVRPINIIKQNNN